jgi:hypothetical protein
MMLAHLLVALLALPAHGFVTREPNPRARLRRAVAAARTRLRASAAPPDASLSLVSVEQLRAIVHDWVRAGSTCPAYPCSYSSVCTD